MVVMVTSSRALRERFLAQVRTGRHEIHVAPWGDDNGCGSESEPYATITTAVAAAEPGDLVLVAAGGYGYTHIRGHRGDPDHWLVVMPRSDPGDVRITMTPPSDNVLNVTDSSYVGLFGLDVYGHQDNPNSNGSGISVYGGSHHIKIWGCHVHDFPGGGINCFDVDGAHDLLDISYNRIHGTSRFSPNNTSGISIHGSRDLTDGTWDGRYANRVIGNYVYDVECTVPFTPGGFDVVTDGNAVSIDDLLARHRYRKPTLVAGNVLLGCGGRAVHVHDSVNCEAVFNTGVGNMRTRSPAISGYSQFDADTDASNRFAHNLICAVEAPVRPDLTSTWTGNIELYARQLDYFATPVDWEELDRGLPVTDFRPRRAHRGKVAESGPHIPLLEALGVSARPAQPARWAIGALEPVATVVGRPQMQQIRAGR